MRLSITSIQNCVFNMGKVLSKYGDDLTRDVLTMEGRFDWGRYDFGTFRRRDVLTMGRFDCKASREPGLASCPLYLLPFVPKENLWDNNGTSFQRSDTHNLTNSIKALKATGSTDCNHGKSFAMNQLLGY